MIMSQAVFMGPEAAGSFTAGQLNASNSDVRSLALILLLLLLQGGGLRQHLVLPAALLAALLLAVLQPVAYRRRRQAIVAGVRLLCAVRVLLAPEPFHFFNDPAMHPVHTSLVKAAMHFCLLVAFESNTLLLTQAAWSLELPPLLAAGVQLLGVALVAARNPRTCSCQFVQQPSNQRLMAVLYRVLQPAVAPLEPLLAAAGVEASNSPDRQCVSVLAVMQVWGALVLPTLLTTRGQLLKYLSWRRQRTGQQRQQRRQARNSAQALAAAAATGDAPASAAAGAAGGGAGATAAPPIASNKSSPASVTAGGHSSSSGHSFSSDSQEDSVPLTPRAVTLAQLLKPARRHGRPHPDDWQYEHAARFMSELELSWLQLTLAGVALFQMYVWHAALFPAVP